MADSCCYEDIDSVEDYMPSEVMQNPIDKCPKTVQETVCVQAQVTITPDVKIGDINFICMDGSIIGTCGGNPALKKECTFEVSQKICVEIPLTFSATAIAVPKGIVCGTPETGKCKKKNYCKLKIIFFGTAFSLYIGQRLVRKRICVKKPKKLQKKL